MLVSMLETLTGIGLATSAGLNAYIPLLIVGLLGRYTGLITLPGPWHWLTNGWVLAILVVLLAIEFVADKIPIVDHMNDVVQTVVRPTAGGLAFGAASSAQTLTVSNPGDFFSNHQWVPIVAGVVISFITHSAKASARPVINASTAGMGAPVASTLEDVAAVFMSIVAIVFPVLIVVFVILLIWLFVALRRRRRRRKEARRARREAERLAAEGSHDGDTRTINLWR
jgi:glucan phosphoethanolaminetransferase (alkaline phosphatase superfamily)